MNGLARCLKEEGHLDEAIAIWERAREGSPEPNDITAELGMAYLEKGEKAKAIPLLEIVVAAHPDNSRLAEALAKARDEN
jgi:Flp pilus assembly protein TadD